MRGTTPATCACIAVAFTMLLTGCTGGPPSHDDAWLSFKVSRNCGSSCAGLDIDFEDEANKYYCSIGVDPTNCAKGAPPTYTLDQWKLDNGFPATGFPPAHAFYANKGDLLLGRDMNCVQNGQSIACYVTNYGPPPFDLATGKENPAWPDLDTAIDDTIKQNNDFATVAMVFNPNGVGPNQDKVTFYVFDGSKKGNNLTTSAALDGEGFKSVPRMCMACHGGTYNLNAPGGFSSATGAYFLPFDVYFLRYSQDETYGLDKQQEGLRQLNSLVKATHTNQSPTNSNLAILEAINDQYPDTGGVDKPGNTAPRDPPLPSGWSQAPPNLYKSVFRVYCRMCHMAQNAVTFREYSQFEIEAPAIQDLVCNSHDMPHAEAAFGSQFKTGFGFWLDGVALNDLKSFLKDHNQSGCP